MGKKNTKRKPKGSSKAPKLLHDIEVDSLTSDSQNDFSLLRVSENLPESPENLIPENADDLREEVIESISQIYTEFLNDYISCKNKRLSSKNPLEKRQTYNLVVDRDFRKKLRHELKQLIYSEGSRSELNSALFEGVHIFIDSLNEQISELTGKSKMLQIICIAEAYHTLQNAATQIGKIVSCLFEGPIASFDTINKLVFHEKIVKNNASLIDYVKTQDPRHHAVQMITKMERELKYALTILASATNPIPPPKPYFDECDLQTHFSDDSYSDSEEEFQGEPLHNMPLDELVSYIEGEPHNSPKRSKKKNKSKASTAATSPTREDEINSDSLDKEIEDFEKRLELSSIQEKQKIKPKLSNDFLNRLKIQIKELKSN
ncbi:unnamed protein product [Blepharisma stoltei]|uniref:Uncharacterized protein n=1 Tax=Blepharisma stoltei TaxID=1481888 RepID=A0AAU9JKZ5_9CILI|nr:unnamed protein product [Blepharisma stoltei]